MGRLGHGWVRASVTLLSAWLCTTNCDAQFASPPSPVVGGKATQADIEPAKPPRMRSLDELLLFHPLKHPHGDWSPRGLNFEDAWFEAADGTKLHGWYCPVEKPTAVVLIAHGNGGNLTFFGQRLALFQARWNMSAMVFDYRGYGRSEGKPTVEGVLQDARAAREFLADRERIDQTEVVLLGSSLGGAVVTRLASEKSPRGLVLESTFSSMREIAAMHYPKLAWIVPRDRLDSVSAINKFDGPLLQCHGNADRVVPYTSGEKLFAAAKEPKTFLTLEGLDHNDPLPAEYHAKLHRFLSDLPAKAK